MQLEHFERQTSRLKIAGLKNDGTSGSVIIALHGWLDNAASFELLAPRIESSRPFYAIDLPGHGFSEHRPDHCSYHLMENIVDVIAFIDSLNSNESLLESGGKKQVTLLGHSLGGIIASMVAAAAPDRVKQLILLDSLGPLTDETESVLPQLRNAVAKASQINSKVSIFPGIELAIRARMAGLGKLSREAAERLVMRGTKEVDGGYSWRTDPKLLKPSFIRLSEAQVEAIFAGIECPVKLLTGDQGYFPDKQAMGKRLAYFKDVEHKSVRGGHHFHMDGDVESTARYINAFIND
jgi:pimeloyl-ACP methyl ester carboxylesterase